MGFDKKGWVILGLLIGILGLLYLFNGSLSGNVIWEPVIEIDNCSEEDIKVLWDEIFVESSDGIALLVENENVLTPDGYCGEWFAYKIINNQEFYILRYDIWESFLDESITLSTAAYYYNATPSLIAVVDGVEDYNNLVFGVSEDDLYNWSINNIGEATSKYNEVFKIGLIGDFVYYAGDYWGPYYEISDSNYGLVNKTFWQRIMVNESAVDISFREIYIPGALPTPSFKQNISNYTFEMNSSWNDAFEIGDIVDLEGGWVAEVVAVSNSIGTKFRVDHGIAQFEPIDGKTGNSSFKLKVTSGDVINYSNIFYINIIEDVNSPPTFEWDLDNIYVIKNGSTSINLSSHFKDEDGDDLSYTTNTLKNINVSFSGDLMTVRLLENFTSYAKFRVYASDGVNDKVSSNEIIVFLNVSNGFIGSDLTNDSSGDLLLYGIDSSNIENGSVNSVGSENRFNWKVLIFVLIGILVIGGIMVGIYFFILRNNRIRQVITPVENNKVNDYLESLKLKKM